ncbi:MAG: beta-phosphoglucomutase [Bacteroidetes bacterium HGW-Bacteroidetes-9]|nr:MAG: beta-phosphoglucomutase [Bacteroidetes bacterium HGW-Bacteroidetes-9]
MHNNRFDAVIFDLDGVITKTALVHSSAWKKMFDEFLKEWEKKHGEPFREFTHTGDYLPYVDGKPRYKGVKDFLISRNIDIPYGDPSDSHDMETVCGLGNRKDFAFNEILRRDGVGVYESTVALIRELKAQNIRIGVASSSKNCGPVLEAAGLLSLFETRVDGVVSVEMNLKGKPEPDIFTTAADNLGVTYDRSVIVEDAVSGVQAGRKGAFGLVIGVAREENSRELLLNGADIVVEDMAEIGINRINDWFEKGLIDDTWSITYNAYESKKERTREALLAVGNGYFGTRGAMEETNSTLENNPGTYIAGLYNRLSSKVGDRMVENEDFVNVPNWLPVNFKIDGGEWFDFNKVEFIEYKKRLDFRTGVFCRHLLFTDDKGRKTKIVSRRIASMEDPHLASLQYELTPVNYSGEITLKSGINGDIINDGVERYKQLNQQHLQHGQQGHGENMVWVSVQTTQSAVNIVEAANHRVFINDNEVAVNGAAIINPAKAFLQFNIKANVGESVRLEKFVAIYTSKADDVKDPLSMAMKAAARNLRFEELKSESAKEWQQLWEKIDIQIEGNRMDQKLLRLHLYHLMVSASHHNAGIDASFTARGLHGEAYRGHIFWDELFILPLYNLHLPEAAKATLIYRYNRLPKAREYAKEHGYTGAMFPWQSGSDGREETQVVHLNPLNGEWGDDYSSLQRHVSLAIAYDVWEYYHTTGDIEFLKKYGAEMFLDICRFWAGKSELNPETGRYSIAKVMGPDEFHEQYHGSSEGGLRDNAYTNIMVVWAIDKAFEILNLIGDASAEVKSKLKLTEEELLAWKDISRKLNIVISPEGIISQYDGYFDLKELDWDYYRQKYGNIYRLDRILKAEGKSADDYKVAKQADTLMAFYNLDSAEVREILEELGYHMKDDYLKDNLAYYLARTSHGSTLSRVVHALLANMIGDRELSWELYQDALSSDYNDIQGGTTAEGIHMGVMAGTVLIAIYAYAGLNLRGEHVRINPNLPDAWRSIKFGFSFKGKRFLLKVKKDEVEIKTLNTGFTPFEVEISGKRVKISNNEMLKVKLK